MGKDAKEHTIFPPVSAKEDMADSKAGSKVGSGLFLLENSVGSFCRSDMMIDLLISNRTLMPKGKALTSTGRDQRRAHHCQVARKNLQYLA